MEPDTRIRLIRVPQALFAGRTFNTEVFFYKCYPLKYEIYFLRITSLNCSLLFQSFDAAANIAQLRTYFPQLLIYCIKTSIR